METNVRESLRNVIDAIAPDGFNVKVGTGQTQDGKRVYAVMSADVAAFPAESLAWIIDRGLACLHAEKLNNVAVDGGAKMRELRAMLDKLNAGEVPQAMRGAAPTKAAAIGDPVLARAVDMWIAETDAKLDRLVKSAKGRRVPNRQEKQDYCKATAPFSALVDASGDWAIGKIADIVKTKPERMEAARDAIAADAAADETPVKLDDLF